MQYLTLFLAGFFLFILGTISFEGYNVINPTNVIERGVIARSGGTLTVTNNYTTLDGLTIDVPRNAYTRDIELIVKEYDLKSYDLPDTINPISPMIELDDQFTDYTSLPVSITVPIDIDSSTTFAMAFYFLEDGTLEAIPTTQLSNHSITIQSLYYRPFFISSINLIELESYATNGNSITTGFEPGEDDWPFANRGSALEPNGHCAGQSLTSMYYYITQTRNGEESLFTAANNDTPIFWFDDRDGYRYSSVIQNKISFTSPAFLSFTDNTMKSDYLSYHGFLYAMHITGNPQFMAIYAHTNGLVFSGHALLAYKAENGRIYVSDPNFPSVTDRSISYSSTSGYTTYNSGDNAQAIQQFQTIDYDTFSFVGISSFVDFDTLQEQFLRYQNGTIGQFLMPTLDVTYTITGEELVLLIEIDSTTIIYTIFINNIVYQTNLINQSVNALEVRIPVEDINGDIGIFAEEVQGSNTFYADYYTIVNPMVQ
jgi:hypothetical protein